MTTTGAWLPIIAIVSSILLALVGYLFTYLHRKQIDERASQLERVNLQLGKLYGPLYAEILAGEAAWDAFSENYWPVHGKEGYFIPDENLSEEEIFKRRIWREEVFHPKNIRIENIIMENIDLLDSYQFPEVFTKLMAHVAGYKAVIRQWAENDFSEFTSVCGYPYSGLIELVEPRYYQLRSQQEYLIKGLKQNPTLSPLEEKKLVDFIEKDRSTTSERDTLTGRL